MSLSRAQVIGDSPSSINMRHASAVITRQEAHSACRASLALRVGRRRSFGSRSVRGPGNPDLE
jgi:hypothetical protein